MKKFLLVALGACTMTPIGQDVKPLPLMSEISDLAVGSTCANFSWSSRGKAPLAYMKGMSLVFAKAVCEINSPANQIISKASTGESMDSLSFYSSEFNRLGMPNIGGVDTLRHAYVMMIGLGMRESSGRYCCGRDLSADNVKSDTVEAGLFQTSWNASYFSSVAKTLSRTDTGCFLSTFYEGVRCPESDLKNWGDGRGLQFQVDSKECPAYGATFAAIIVRKGGGLKGHYGPIRRKEVQIRPECNDLLLKVQKMVESNPAFCEVLK